MFDSSFGWKVCVISELRWMHPTVATQLSPIPLYRQLFCKGWYLPSICDFFSDLELAREKSAIYCSLWDSKMLKLTVINWLSIELNEHEETFASLKNQQWNQTCFSRLRLSWRVGPTFTLISKPFFHPSIHSYFCMVLVVIFLLERHLQHHFFIYSQ